MSYKRNENGLVIRARRYERKGYDEMARDLGLGRNETIYRAGVEQGARQARPLKPGAPVEMKPGDIFIVGPSITKAAGPAGETSAKGQARGGITPLGSKREIPSTLRSEIRQLKTNGFGAVPDPELTDWGWSIRLKGLVLPNGARSDALILLPDNYPLVSPIGFYLKQDALTGKLDTSHLFASKAYHGAQDLSAHGWHWFCGIVEGWQPGVHTLLTYILIVLSLFNDLET